MPLGFFGIKSFARIDLEEEHTEKLALALFARRDLSAGRDDCRVIPSRDTMLALKQSRAQLLRRLVPVFRIVLAGFEDDIVEAQKLFMTTQRSELARQIRKLPRIFARADFVQHLAQAKEIGQSGAGSFRGQITWRANTSRSLVQAGDEPNISQFQNALDKNDVRGLQIAMHHSLLMQIIESGCQSQSGLETFHQRQCAAVGYFTP